jgi:hypothetical protein
VAPRPGGERWSESARWDDEAWCTLNVQRIVLMILSRSFDKLM